MKKQLGQYMTTNYEEILKGVRIPESVIIVEPFVGCGDLLNILSTQQTELYDISPPASGTLQQTGNIVRRDTLRDPPDYNGKFILTNPPYLAKNKARDKSIYNLYRCDDLYKCFIKSFLIQEPIGGVIIIPLNFISSMRKADILLRAEFMSKFYMFLINIFEYPVFNDTSYTICAIQFQRSECITKTIIYGRDKETEIYARFNKKNNMTYGGEIYTLPQSDYHITRLISGMTPNTNILAKCIDDATRINLSIVLDENIYYDNTPRKSARSYATLVITPIISRGQQEQLVRRFNRFLEKKRLKYHSLFLTNFREYSRKRISFDLVYKIVSFLLLKVGEPGNE